MADREAFGAIPAPLVHRETRMRLQVRRLPWTYWALGAFALMVAAQHVVSVAADLPRLAEVGYGDSYIWYDVEHYRQTGQIFHNLADPPYNPTIYSPLLYMALASPPRWVSAHNPFLGPRLVVLLFFAACTLLT